MKLYTNTIPFSFEWNADEPVFLPVGTTFAVMGADFNGVLLKRVGELKEGDKKLPIQSISPSILGMAFKEVEQLDS